ncbi:MAG: M20/M25/M40 family metallo-hydrolase [Dehalococcoidia bacterium]
MAIAEIPAPTGAEHRRADLVERRLRALGAEDVRQFGSGNVMGRLGPAAGKGLALVAHLDTVFSDAIDHTVTRRNGKLFGPGVGDNSAGVAGILTVLAAARTGEIAFERPVWFVADVGEEGLGDLRGVRETMEQLRDRIETVIAVEGTMLGRLGHIAVGSRRLRVTFRAEGGHSWLDFGKPSAVHALVAAAAAIARLNVPAEPRTTFNIGRIEGGDGVNVVAATAAMVLDMRSISADALLQLNAQVERILAERRPGITVEVDEVGSRPAGSIPRAHQLVEICAEALERAGVRGEPTAGSTDANLPLSMGIPAVALGITHGGGIHSAGEWIEVEPMNRGVVQLLLVCAALAAG